MQSGFDPILFLDQAHLQRKLGYFLSFLGEAIPIETKGLCSGYAFMLFRADVNGDEEKYWQRLLFLSAAGQT